MFGILEVSSIRLLSFDALPCRIATLVHFAAHAASKRYGQHAEILTLNEVHPMPKFHLGILPQHKNVAPAQPPCAQLIEATLHKPATQAVPTMRRIDSQMPDDAATAVLQTEDGTYKAGADYRHLTQSWIPRQLPCEVRS